MFEQTQGLIEELSTNIRPSRTRQWCGGSGEDGFVFRMMKRSCQAKEYLIEIGTFQPIISKTVDLPRENRYI